MDHVLEAMRMVESFIAAGAHAFDISVTRINKQSAGYLAGERPAQLRERLGYLVAASHRDKTNLIIRPHTHYPGGLLQLDDIFPRDDGTNPAVCVSAAPHQSWRARPAGVGGDGVL